MHRIDIDAMLEEMSAEQLLDWLQFYNSEPWGYEVENTRAGTIAASIMNSVGGKKSGQAYTWKDFFPSSNNKNNSKQSTDEMFDIASKICTAIRKE